MTQPFLELIHLKKNFGGVTAIDDLNIKVSQGSITSIIGPNGAGKTTAFNLITGFCKPTQGHIRFCSQDISAKKPHHIAKAGIARTFQNIRIFSNMTVLENVMVGRHIRSYAGWFQSVLIPPFLRKEEQAVKAAAKQWLSFVGMADQSDKLAGSLPLGNQRMLEIARALALEPQLILLDEPASGLNTRETLSMGKLIAKIKDMGITVLLVEHDMELVMEISDRVAVINFGKCIAQGSPSEIQANPDVIAAYLGE